MSDSNIEDYEKKIEDLIKINKDTVNKIELLEQKLKETKKFNQLILEFVKTKLEIFEIKNHLDEKEENKREKENVQQENEDEKLLRKKRKAPHRVNKANKMNKEVTPIKTKQQIDAFKYYFSKRVKELSEKEKQLTMNDRLRMIASEWTSLTDDEKNYYEKLANLSKK